jgi:hypothetical protein
MQSDIFTNKAKNTRIENGTQIPDELINEWDLYKRKVRNETNKHKKLLFNEWDGYDFYDNEYIKDNLENFKPRNSNYPSIDHKISVSYGFLNNISEKTIGSIENLCITKTKINCSKRELNYNDFVL